MIKLFTLNGLARSRPPKGSERTKGLPRTQLHLRAPTRMAYSTVKEPPDEIPRLD